MGSWEEMAVSYDCVRKDTYNSMFIYFTKLILATFFVSIQWVLTEV